MSKRVVLLSIVVGVVVVALAGTAILQAKAHVPLGRVQICTANGTVKNIAPKVLAGRLSAGACRLTACVFDEVDGDDLITQYIFLPGNECDSFDGNGDGFCDAVGSPADIPKRLSAVNVTTACTDSF